MGFRFTIRNEKDTCYAVAEGCEDPGKVCAVPARTEGAPVREVASRALAGRNEIRRLILPDTIRKIGSFAFYNCRNLESIRFESSEISIAGGIVGFCRKLERVEIVFSSERFAFLKDLVGQTDRDLTVHLELPGDHTAELFFPEYTEGMDEDTHARAFHPWCDGSGIAFRECVGRDAVDYAAYDRLFGRAVTDGWEKAFRVAVSRLMHPYRLRGEAAETYRAYLRENSGAVLGELTRKEEREKVLFLLEEGIADPEAAGKTALAASGRKDPVLVSALMEYSRPERETTGSAGFDLDELL